MKLILISYPDFFLGESDIVCSLMRKYNFDFHLRKPIATAIEYELFVKSIPKEFHNRIILHKAHELQEKYHIKGLHFPGHSRHEGMKIHSNGTKSTSCHSLTEVVKAECFFDYVFLSPVFPSISKKGYQGNLNMKEVSDYLKKERKTKVYALGGIDHTKPGILKQNHFDGIAVLGAVWTETPEAKTTIENNFYKIYNCLQKEYVL